MLHRLWARRPKILWFDFCQCEENPPFFKPPRELPGPIRPPTQWALGVLHPAVNWPGHEADRSSVETEDY